MNGFAQKASGLFTAIILLAFYAPGVAADGDWVEESDAVSLRVLETHGRYTPESIAAVGLAQFDPEVIDLGPGLHERRMADFRAAREYVAAVRETMEDPRVLQDLSILDTSLRDDLATQAIERESLLPWYNLPELMLESFQSLLDPRNDPARYPAALVRLEKYIGAAAGHEPVTTLAIARTRERFDTAGLAGPYQGEVERALENLPRYLAGIRDLFQSSDLEDWEPEFGQLERQLDDWRDWVREELLPRTRDDHRLPEAVYANNLREYGVRDTPEQLIRNGQFAYQEIRAQMRTVARQIAMLNGWEDARVASVIRRLKRKQIPEGKVLSVYRERLSTIEDIIRREHIVTLPDRPAGIRLATEAEMATSPAPFMSPPQLVGNTGQYGEFVLVTHNPALDGPAARMDDWTHEGMTWALTVHEARPGHELQFAALVENGTSLARALFAFNSANVEGWGLYAEALMLEYMPPEGQLFTLLARLQRAARLFMDPMINLGRLAPGQAVTFMTDEIGLSEAMARSEADRYAFRAPGQATSYFYGYMNLARLRTETELALGSRFNQRAFHDFILSQGLLPPELLRRAVRKDFLPAAEHGTDAH